MDKFGNALCKKPELAVQTPDLYYWGLVAKSTKVKALEVIVSRFSERPKKACADKAFLRRCTSFAILTAWREESNTRMVVHRPMNLDPSFFDSGCGGIGWSRSSRFP
ncbi:MAG: hypothetical protein HYY45_21915 [Deltaproteobacteria bacterium]|nr:hypothetical protein [Deltaproteobacteria bacterium]